MDISFVSSNRFIAIVLVAAISVIKGIGWLDFSVADPLIVLLLSFVGVRTIDRFSEKLALPE